MAVAWLLAAAGCTTTESLDNMFTVEGTVSDQQSAVVDSVAVTLVAVDAVPSSHSAYDHVGTVAYTTAGQYLLGFPASTTWEESATGDKSYTKYVGGATLEFSKPGYRDTVVSVSTADYESTSLILDVVLSAQQ